MLKLFGNRRVRVGPEPFSVPARAGGVIYAVGDVHGRHDLLVRLLDRISSDVDEPAPLIVFMGDYIDRGEHARETIGLLMDFKVWAGDKAIFLMGNHEQMLLRFLDDPASGARWLKYGGLQTLMSYGIGGAGSLRTEAEASRIRDELIDALGSHLEFIMRLRISHRVGDLFFAHAGADPARPVHNQDPGTLLWGCEGFLTRARGDGIWVVHGHYVVEQPAAERGRIAVDTGAYFSGKLTAARIANGKVTFVQG